MRYELDLSQKLDFSAPPVTGSDGLEKPRFHAWQPSTWPDPPPAVDQDFIRTLKRIFEDSILGEINNVISDAEKCNGGLQFRGHVVAIALFCALDTISSYGYGARSGNKIPDFVRAHFPAEFAAHADLLLPLYRHTMVHSWNLFEASVSPGNAPITYKGTISFGLLTFFGVLVHGTESFLNALETDPTLQANTLKRYGDLKGSARP